MVPIYYPKIPRGCPIAVGIRDMIYNHPELSGDEYFLWLVRLFGRKCKRQSLMSSYPPCWEKLPSRDQCHPGIPRHTRYKCLENVDSLCACHIGHTMVSPIVFELSHWKMPSLLPRKLTMSTVLVIVDL